MSTNVNDWAGAEIERWVKREEPAADEIALETRACPDGVILVLLRWRNTELAGAQSPFTLHVTTPETVFYLPLEFAADDSALVNAFTTGASLISAVLLSSESARAFGAA